MQESFSTTNHGNLRSTMASVFPLFGSAFFRNLGVGPGSSLLAGLSIGLMPIYYVSLALYFISLEPEVDFCSVTFSC